MGTELEEAATVKARLQGMLKAADETIADKSIPDKVKDMVKGVRSSLLKRWKEIAGETSDPSDDPDVEEALREAITKSEGAAGDFPASDYAYVPDAESPSTWKLRLTAKPGGPPDPGIVGAAAAALGPGFRGQKVQIPAKDLSTVKGKVRTAWKKANPDKGDDEMPDGIKESKSSMIDGDMLGDFVPLVERATRGDGSTLVKLIQPGWGTSGYYSPEVLERDGPKVFRTGTKMFWDHPTLNEEAERPEGSLRSLAGELASDARFIEQGPEGPGLYADAKVFSTFRGVVDELAPHIGVSIRASGGAKEGEVEGRRGPIIERLVAARSVDFVTSPGAGGKVVELFEAARPGKKEEGMELKEALDKISGLETKLSEAETREKATVKERDDAVAENKKFKETALVSEARTKIESGLADVNLPDAVKKRIAESVSRTPPIKEDTEELDAKALAKRVKEAVEAEVEYLIEATGKTEITGFGSDGGNDGGGDGKVSKLEERMAKGFQRLGLQEATAKIAAGGR